MVIFLNKHGKRRESTGRERWIKKCANNGIQELNRKSEAVALEACLRTNENYTTVPATPWFDASIH